MVRGVRAWGGVCAVVRAFDVVRGEGAPELGCTKRFVSTWCSDVFKSHLHCEAGGGGGRGG